MDISCLMNESVRPVGPALEPFGLDVAQRAARFHASLPGYAPTPLVALPGLARRLGIGTLAIKDESQRFDLNAFKVLGASFAIAKHLAALVGLGDAPLTFDAVARHRGAFRDVTFVTATDGNHGRAVAWSARLFGCTSVVYMPRGTATARLEAIRSYGSDASITSLTYDDAVLLAERKAREEGWVLVQDTS